MIHLYLHFGASANLLISLPLILSLRGNAAESLRESSFPPIRIFSNFTLISDSPLSSLFFSLRSLSFSSSSACRCYLSKLCVFHAPRQLRSSPLIPSGHLFSLPIVVIRSVPTLTPRPLPPIEIFALFPSFKVLPPRRQVLKVPFLWARSCQSSLRFVSPPVNIFGLFPLFPLPPEPENSRLPKAFSSSSHIPLTLTD